MIKRVIAFLLSAIMIIPVLSGCSKYDPNEDVGETINIYLSNEVYDFDPAFAYRSKDALQISRLLFAGLFYINADGELKKNLVDDYEITDDDDKEIYRITFELKESYWSDGSLVSAKDYLFAWKRLLDPNVISDAAVLLYEIKNAYDAKNGNCSIDDIGVYAINNSTLQIDFEKPIDFEDFLYNLASPCLVPLRESTVSGNDDWSKRPLTILCNGPFIIREVSYGSSLVLERNAYFKRDREKDSIKKYVTPYRIVVDYTKTPAEQIEAYKNGEIDYVGNIALSNREEYESKAKISDALSTLSCYFNLDNEIFADANTRKALSLAIDRQAIADALVFASPATALVPSGVFEATSAKKSFRSVGGDYLAKNADLDAAKQLGSFSGSFSISLADNEVNIAVAEMLKSAWEQLGFDVDIVKLSTTPTKVVLPGEKAPTKEFVNDAYLTCLRERNFDVILTEVSALDTDAFSILAPFAEGYTGRNIEFTVDSYTDPVNITGYNSDEYNALIDSAFAEKKVSARASILHEAEEMLMTDLPVVPLVFTKNAVLISGDLENITRDYFGYRSFTKAELD